MTTTNTTPGWTPGPWHVESARVLDANGDHVAMVHLPSIASYFVKDAQWRHNRNLISAAPELAEAVSVLCDMLDIMLGDDISGSKPRQQARAALAKARGEEA